MFASVWRSGRAAGSPLLATLTGELVVGGVFSVIRTSMLEGDGGKLVELAPSLMAFIVAPYLGQAAAQAELEGRPSGSGQASASRARAYAGAGDIPRGRASDPGDASHDARAARDRAGAVFEQS